MPLDLPRQNASKPLLRGCRVKVHIWWCDNAGYGSGKLFKWTASHWGGSNQAASWLRGNVRRVEEESPILSVWIKKISFIQDKVHILAILGTNLSTLDPPRPPITT